MSSKVPQTITDLVFDLDDTLLNTSELLIPQTAKHVYKIMAARGFSISEDEFLKARHEMAKNMGHKEIFTLLANQHCLNKLQAAKCAQSAIDAFYNPTLPKTLPLMEGALAVLKAAQKKNLRMHLITSGITSAQNRKIDAMGLSPYFNSVQVTGFGSKTEALQKVLQQSFLSSNQMLSIGNRLSHEIRDSKSIGAWTCHFAFGEHLGEVELQPEDHPDFKISHWKEFPKVCPFLNLPM